MMTKKSPRFLFLGNAVEAVQTGPDTFEDVFADPAGGGDITASTVTGKVRIRLPDRTDAYVTSMNWPKPGYGLVEIAPAVLEAVKQADPEENDNVLRALRHEVESYLSLADIENDDPATARPS